MEFLRLLFQLGKATLGIDVDGIFCDFALRQLVSAASEDIRNQAHHGAQRRTGGVGRTRLNFCLIVCGAYTSMLLAWCCNLGQGTSIPG